MDFVPGKDLYRILSEAVLYEESLERGMVVKQEQFDNMPSSNIETKVK